MYILHYNNLFAYELGDCFLQGLICYAAEWFSWYLAGCVFPMQTTTPIDNHRTFGIYIGYFDHPPIPRDYNPKRCILRPIAPLYMQFFPFFLCPFHFPLNLHFISPPPTIVFSIIFIILLFINICMKIFSTFPPLSWTFFISGIGNL